MALIGGLAALAPAGATVREHLPQTLTLVPQAPSQPAEQPSPIDHVLRQNGLEPGSKKAQIVAAWLEKVHTDPAIKRAVPGGPDALHRILSDANTRDSLMTNGLARLSPADRLRYLKVYTRILDEQVPVNCFGVSDMGEVMDRITLGAMAQGEIEEYLGLLYKVIVKSASSSALPTPTQRQYEKAQGILTRALVNELAGDSNNIERYRYLALHPESATPADMCWVTRVTLHAVLSMPDPYRDFIVLPAMTKDSEIIPSRGKKTDSDFRRPPPTQTP